MLGYGNILIFETEIGDTCILLDDVSFVKEIGDILEQPIYDFGRSQLHDSKGRPIFGKGFVFPDPDSALKSVREIVEKVYRKKGLGNE